MDQVKPAKQKILSSFLGRLEFLFPPVEIYHQKWTIRQNISIFFAFASVFYIAGYFLPADGFIAYDWVNFFAKGLFPPFYPPWGEHIYRWLNWPLMVSLSMAGVVIAILKRSVNWVSGIAAMFSLPVFWTIFLGQMEGLIVLGLFGLPWLTPLALLKPQISIFAFGAKKTYILACLIWLSISIVIWGDWPIRLLSVNSYYPEGRYVQDISIGLLGVFVALPMFWYSRGDPDMLMVSGSFVTLHLIPYNLLPFTPAIARLQPIPALIACMLSWLPLSANWLGASGWWLGWLYIIWLWGCLAAIRYKKISGQPRY